MRRTIVRIDEGLCNGCGRCVIPCVEGAIAIVNGKARVLREELCDGLGYCVGLCPTGALSVEVREAAPFDERASGKQAEKVRFEPRAKCFRCGKTELDIAVLPVRFHGRSEWVCVKCVPYLIHADEP